MKKRILEIAAKVLVAALTAFLTAITTHEGSGLANCVEDVKAAFAGANVTKGFCIYGHEVRSNKAKVEKWLREVKSEK